jgi:putative transposase
MTQMTRNVVDERMGALRACRYMPGPRRQVLRCFRRRPGVRGTPLSETPGAQPNLNAFAERWVRSVKEECISKLIPFGERLAAPRWPSSRRTFILTEIIRARAISCCSYSKSETNRDVQCGERLGGLPRYCSRAA